MTREIIFGDAECAEKVCQQVRSNELFKTNKTHLDRHTVKILKTEKTYPESLNDAHVTVTFEGREKDLHAIRSMANLCYGVSTWKCR